MTMCFPWTASESSLIDQSIASRSAAPLASRWGAGREHGTASVNRGESGYDFVSFSGAVVVAAHYVHTRVQECYATRCVRFSSCGDVCMLPRGLVLVVSHGPCPCCCCTWWTLATLGNPPINLAGLYKQVWSGRCDVVVVGFQPCLCVRVRAQNTKAGLHSSGLVPCPLLLFGSYAASQFDEPPPSFTLCSLPLCFCMCVCGSAQSPCTGKDRDCCCCC